MKNSKKRLVLDESFVDFCSYGMESTMLDQNIIERYPNLIAIKSISKSYGVPGIRLGVLASGDFEIIRKIRKHLSIWNINSFGEFFLQIIGKYKKEYKIACERIIGERERFRRELETIPFLKVLPSQANYLMCRCTGDFTARDLTKYLLGNHDIYIKDLTGKKGIKDDRWIRLAVRDRTDNDVLIEKLKLFAKEMSN